MSDTKGVTGDGSERCTSSNLVCMAGAKEPLVRLKFPLYQ